jgi:hypothetical protein
MSCGENEHNLIFFQVGFANLNRCFARFALNLLHQELWARFKRSLKYKPKLNRQT